MENKKHKQPTKTCSDCIHENACRVWTDGRFISDASASVCPNHETVKESGAYLCGVLDERKRKQTNADRILAMSDEELAELIVKNKPLYSWPKAVREIWMQRNVTKVQAWVMWLQQPAEGE